MKKYKPSLFDTEDGACWKCGFSGETARHECYYGRGTRDKSKVYGLWCCLCPRCHAQVHADPNSGLDLELKAEARRLFEAAYPDKDFVKIFITGAEKSWEE